MLVRGIGGMTSGPFGAFAGCNPLVTLKPGVNRSVHLFFAPFLWSAIGTLLMVRGWSWSFASGALWPVPLGLVLGTCKSRLILDRAARRAVQRLVCFEDGTCLGAVYSWQTWLLVLLMMAGGMAMRRLLAPGPVIGALYLAVGWSLFYSSRFGWGAWLRVRKDG